jgi:hypothetical protein
MDLKNQKDNFLFLGYYYDECPNIDFSFFEDKEFKDCTLKEPQFLNYEIKQRLKQYQKKLSEIYISEFFDNFEYRDCGMWKGVDEGSSKWHNDYLDGDNFNSNILVYLDDNNEKNGNSIEVRGPGFSHKIYPQKNQLIWLNQKRIFQHKATHSGGERRLLSFEYFIPDITK